MIGESLADTSARYKLTVLRGRSSLGEKASSEEKKATGAETIETRDQSELSLEISELPDVFL